MVLPARRTCLLDTGCIWNSVNNCLILTLEVHLTNTITMGLDRFDIKDRESTLLTEAIVIVDKETGVNYLYVGRGYGGGLTPLLDADGKVIVTKA